MCGLQTLLLLDIAVQLLPNADLPRSSCLTQTRTALTAYWLPDNYRRCKKGV